MAALLVSARAYNTMEEEQPDMHDQTITLFREVFEAKRTMRASTDITTRKEYKDLLHHVKEVYQLRVDINEDHVFGQ